MNTSGIKVVEPFRKRSPLRELAEYFFQGRLSREDYVRHRQHLIDHLCGLESQPDPLVLMLIRQSESSRDTITDTAITGTSEPKDRTPSKMLQDTLGATAPPNAAIPRAPTEVRQAVQVKSPDDAGVVVTRPIVKPLRKGFSRSITPARVIAAVLLVAVLLVLILRPTIFVTH